MLRAGLCIQRSISELATPAIIAVAARTADILLYSRLAAPVGRGKQHIALTQELQNNAPRALA